AGVFAGAVMHTPVEVTQEALRAVSVRSADAVVAVGGGSTTGLGKAIALRTDLPQIVLPTTYAGSEMTPILGETRDGVKTTLRDPRVLARGRHLRRGPDARLAREHLGSVGHERHRPRGRGALRQGPEPGDLAHGRGGIAALARALPRISEVPEDPDARSEA